MSVRRRQWVSPFGRGQGGVGRRLRDQHGSRHIKTFTRKRDADAHHAVVAIDIRAGVHTADSRSGTVAEAGQRWLESSEAAGLERATLAAYRQHLELHIVPLIGGVKLSQLTVPLVRGFEDRLRGTAARRRWCARPGARSAASSPTPRSAASWVRTWSTRCARTDASRLSRRNGKLKIGTDIPSPVEMRAIVAALPTIEDAHAGGRSCSPRSSPACGPRSFAGSHGTTST